MKILYLSHRIPFPPNKGDKIRSFNEVKYLSNDHEIHLGCIADDPTDLKYEIDLKRYCQKLAVEPVNKIFAKGKSALHIFSNTALSIGYFYSSHLQRIIDNWLSAYVYDAVICFSSPMAEYLFRSTYLKERFKSDPLPRTSHPLPRLIMDFCDLDSDKWLQYARKSYFPLNIIYGIENNRLLKYEKIINQRFDHSVFVSWQESDLFFQRYPQAKNVSAIPNGVDHEYFKPQTPNPEPRIPNPVLLFTGAMDYHANAEGVAWFCKDVYPIIKRDLDKTEFYIVGSNPIPKVKALADNNGIRVTGYVEDIRPFYQKADVCVVPLRLARGIQNKILEAMAVGKAVVATSMAAEGIAANPGEHLLIENTPNGFAHAITFLIKNRETASKIGSNARKFVVEKHNWSKNMKKFEDLLK